MSTDNGSDRPSEDQADPLVLVRRELFSGGLITAVFHEWDGDWQYLTEAGYERNKTDLVHQSHVLEADPTLRSTLEMPVGVWAGRKSKDGPWQFEVLEEGG